MKLGVMCSGNGTNFQNLVTYPQMKHEVVVMVHNKRECGAARRAEKYGITHTHIKSKNEELIIQVMQAWKVDYIVLAGWMRIITPKLIEAFPNKIINLHPSMLPKYKGLHAIERALESGDNMTGVTVHYVNEELDGGEIIMQEEVPILPDDDIDSLTKAIQRREYYLLPRAIQHVKQRL